MQFLNKYYKPWSILWVFQRFIMVFKEGRLFSIQWNTLFYDFRLNKEIKKKMNLHPNQPKIKAENNIPELLDFTPEFEFNPLISCEKLESNQLSSLNSYFDKIYVVNLEKRADRRMEMIQKLTKLNIRAEFFVAENGYSETNVREYKAYFEKPIDDENAHELEKKYKRKVIYSPGAWGTLKTYKRLFTEAINNNYEKILCLQDDVIFDSSFEQKFSALADKLPKEWKALYLGATQHAWEPGIDFIQAETNILGEGEFSLYHPVSTDGAFAVGIHSSMFPQLLNEIEKMNCSFDSGALRSIGKTFNSESYVLDPNLIIADVNDSDIRTGRDQVDFAKTSRWNLASFDYPFEAELVSIVMPAYNAATTITQSIQSILAQSYPNLELIVADDCSTDDTAKVVKEIARNNKRVKYIKLPENQGCYAARNAGIRASKGAYISFQDADDISLKNRIELQVLPLMLGKAEFTMARILRSTDDVNDFDIHNQDTIIQQLISGPAGKDEINQKNKVGYITSMFKRELFEEVGLFWENRFGADAEFVERILFKKEQRLLPKNVFAQNFLSQVKSIDKLYERIDKIICVSFVQGDQNLSLKHKEKERLEYQQRYRACLQGEFDYVYPRLDN